MEAKSSPNVYLEWEIVFASRADKGVEFRISAQLLRVVQLIKSCC
jgi:hypothetical protein